MTEQSSIVAALKKMPYLTRTSDPALQGLAQIITLRDVPAGTMLINEGDVGEEAYLLFSGALFVEKKTDAGSTLVAVCSPGSIVGEMALLTRDPRSATVVAHIDSVVAVLNKKAFDLFRGTGPAVAENMIREMTRRMRSAINRMNSVKLILLPTRLAITLGDLARDFGVADGAAVRINLPLDIQNLADLAVCTADEAAAVVKDWEANGYLKQDGTAFILLKPEEF